MQALGRVKFFIEDHGYTLQQQKALPGLLVQDFNEWLGKETGVQSLRNAGAATSVDVTNMEFSRMRAFADRHNINLNTYSDFQRAVRPQWEKPELKGGRHGRKRAAAKANAPE